MARVHTVLNNFDLLDPIRELKDIDLALGTTTIHDKWSEGDPTLAAARINAAKANTIGTTELLDPYRALVALNAVINT